MQDPNRKGTVENAIQHTQETALEGRRFASIEKPNTWRPHAAKRDHGARLIQTGPEIRSIDEPRRGTRTPPP